VKEEYMSRALILGLALLLAAPARADVEPPAKATVFLGLAGVRDKVESIKVALRAALPRLSRGWSVSVLNGCSESYQRTEPTRETSELVEAVGRASGCAGSQSAAFFGATRRWGSAETPRHHFILISGQARTEQSLGFMIDMLVRRHFTVSLIFLEKLAAADRKALPKRSAGRLYEATPGASLTAALRTELAWSKLSKPQQQALAAAIKQQSKSSLKVSGVLGRIGGSGSGDALGGLIGNKVGDAGFGGLGVVGGKYSPKSARLRRAESLLGAKLALTFRAVSCESACDQADARRQLRAAARPLLECLEKALSLSGSEEVTATFAGTKVSGTRTPANTCLQSWLPKAPKGVSGTLIIGPASAVSE
jgi:hypothetical protein